ncbi:hypothetical protein mEp013_92 [Escherichia phage mEp013]
MYTESKKRKQYQQSGDNMKRYVVVMLNKAFEQVEVAIVKGFDDAFKYGQFMMNAKEDEYRDFFLKVVN